MSVFDTRHEQMFPVLSPAQIEVARRFASGPPRRFEPGTVMVEVGELAAPVWLVLAGSIEAAWRDGLGHETAIGREGPGQFSGEVSQLASHTSLVVGRAGAEGCTAIPFDSAHLRALIIGSADIGEIVMRAFILRRVGLIEGDRSGSILIGHAGTPDVVRLEGFLTRNAYPVSVLDSGDDPEARALVERLGIHDDEQPVLLCPNGTVLRRPTNEEAGRCLGLTPKLDPGRLYDVAVVGAGPGRARHRRLRRVRGPLGAGARPARHRRPGRRIGPHRELPGIPHRHLGPGPGRTRLYPGAEVRHRARHPTRSRAARLRRSRRSAAPASSAVAS